MGKIELPEPKKKETSKQPEGTSEPSGEESPAVEQTPVGGSPRPSDPGMKGTEIPRRRNDGRRQDNERGPRRNQGRDQRSLGNPIAAQREREQQQELEKRKEKAAQDKERRTQNYNKRVKQSPPTKAVRLIEDQVEQLDSVSLSDKPKSWIGRLFKWLGL